MGANDAASRSSGRAKLVQIGTPRTYKPNSRPVDSLRVAGRRKSWSGKLRLQPDVGMPNSIFIVGACEGGRWLLALGLM